MPVLNASKEIVAQTAASYNVSHHDQHNGHNKHHYKALQMIIDFHLEWIKKTFSRAQMFFAKVDR